MQRLTQTSIDRLWLRYISHQVVVVLHDGASFSKAAFVSLLHS